MRLGLPGPGQVVGEAQARAGDRLAWSRLIRAKEIAAARAVLAEPGTYGVVITGDPSFGKAALASALLADLGDGVHTVRLRSTIAGSETPYGALAVLLARLPEDSQGDPGMIMRGILQLLSADSAGRTAVMALETAHHLDELSTATLVNVMVTGTAKLVIVADRASELPADFHWMLSEQRLKEIQLAVVDPEEMVEGLRSLLGGLVPQTVGLQLHAMSRGNPQVALLTVSELLQNGALTVSDGVWMLAPDADTRRIRQLDDLIRARVQRERPEVQTIIEALACARRIPLARLIHAFGDETVAHMEDEGLIAVDESGRHSVALMDPLMGDVVRGWLSVPRRRELRALLMADGEPPLEVITNLELLGLAAWTRECHGELPVRHAIAAAVASLRLYDAEFALACLEGVERDPATWATVQRLRARASLALQLPKQALAYLEQVGEAEMEEQTPSGVAKFVATKAEAMRRLQDRAAEVEAYLDDARGRLLVRIGMGDVPDGEARRASAIIDLAEFEHWAFVGDFRRIVGRLEATVGEPYPPDEEIQLLAACILMDARAVLGREQDALALLHEIASQLSQRPASVRVRQEFSSRAFTVLLYNGHWRQALALLRGTPQWSLERLKTNGATVELAAGLAHVYAGRGHEALGPLLSATALLERGPGRSSLGPAYAATAFAYAQDGDEAAARAWLDKLEGWSAVCSYGTRTTIEFCSEMARRWIGDRDAAPRLIASAREDIALGRWNPAGIKLVGATVEARPDDLRLLEEVCAHRQGQLAELGRLLARGTRTGRTDDLSAAADLAAALELDALESRCAAVGLDRAREEGDPVMVRLMQARLDALAGRVAVLPVVPNQSMPALTQREREVAALAARGASNRRIADDLGLSVRTVEGHLYQVFAKLSVSTRSELAGLL